MRDIEQTLQYIRDNAAKYAEHKANCEYLKEFRKCQKAILINEAEQKGIKTAQERESYAYSHEDYMKLLKGLEVAIEESERYRLSIKAAELRIEVWRSQNARNIAEMKLR